MHMATETRRWTRADLERMPENGKRYEVLDGELLVTPAAARAHQLIASRLHGPLWLYATKHGLGDVYSYGKVLFGGNELLPDVQVMRRVAGSELELDWETEPATLLAVEILSPSTKRRDLTVKRDAYQRVGIPVYWIVDPVKREVLVYSGDAAEPEVVTSVLRWQPRVDLPALELSVEAIFK